MKDTLAAIAMTIAVIGALPQVSAGMAEDSVAVVQSGIDDGECAPSPLHTTKAVLTNSMIGRIVDDLRRIESSIKYDEPADPYFGYIKGTIPILISAPHGAKHYRTRESRLKGEDAYTGAQAIKLGEMTGAHVIYVKNRAPEDPNNDYRTKYKDFLEQVVKENRIRFVMDLHGAKITHPFSVDVGTFTRSLERSSCPQQLETITKALSDLNGVAFNRRFTANGRGTITYFAARSLGIGAAQFETNALYRVPALSGSTGAVTNGREIVSVLLNLEMVIRSINDLISAAHEARPLGRR